MNYPPNTLLYVQVGRWLAETQVEVKAKWDITNRAINPIDKDTTSVDWREGFEWTKRKAHKVQTLQYVFVHI